MRGQVLSRLSLTGLLRYLKRQYLVYCLLHWIGKIQVTSLPLGYGQKIVVSLFATRLLYVDRLDIIQTG